MWWVGGYAFCDMATSSSAEAFPFLVPIPLLIDD